MSLTRPLPGCSTHAQRVAWFQAWLRAVHSGDARLVALATAELRRLGVEARAVPGSTW